MRRNKEGSTNLDKKYSRDLIAKPGYAENIVASSDEDEITENSEKCAIGSYSATSVSSLNYVSIFTFSF